ncbi:hypothetical protein H9P43_002715 [Blastocladiella emersonii ATCC 22665]|nr:hypothetical protein H9P43_002715 [Blastocladiella emersonii ATCC 22665]
MEAEDMGNGTVEVCRILHNGPPPDENAFYVKGDARMDGTVEADYFGSHSLPIKRVLLDYDMTLSESQHTFDITNILPTPDLNHIVGCQVYFRDIYRHRLHLDTAAHSVEFDKDEQNRITMTIVKDMSGYQFFVRVLLDGCKVPVGRTST